VLSKLALSAIVPDPAHAAFSSVHVALQVGNNGMTVEFRGIEYRTPSQPMKITLIGKSRVRNAGAVLDVNVALSRVQVPPYM
jgi:hypothetical protein